MAHKWRPSRLLSHNYYFAKLTEIKRKFEVLFNYHMHHICTYLYNYKVSIRYFIVWYKYEPMMGVSKYGRTAVISVPETRVQRLSTQDWLTMINVSDACVTNRKGHYCWHALLWKNWPRDHVMYLDHVTGRVMIFDKIYEPGTLVTKNEEVLESILATSSLIGSYTPLLWLVAYIIDDAIMNLELICGFVIVRF